MQQSLLGIALHQGNLCMTPIPAATSIHLCAAITLGLYQPNEWIFLSMVHQIYGPNYLKFHISESCSKEGRLTYTLSGFLSQTHYHGVESGWFTARSPAHVFLDPTFHTNVPIKLAKKTNFPETIDSFFSVQTPVLCFDS